MGTRELQPRQGRTMLAHGVSRGTREARGSSSPVRDGTRQQERHTMAHSFGKLLYHVIFSTKMCHPTIVEPWRSKLFGYIHGILEYHGGHLLRGGGTADHIHLLLELRNDITVAEAVRLMKANSSKWIHESFDQSSDFSWQTGYAAFTVSLSAVDDVTRYIDNQEEHHRKTTFEEEFALFLRRHGIQ